MQSQVFKTFLGAAAQVDIVGLNLTSARSLHSVALVCKSVGVHDLIGGSGTPRATEPSFSRRWMRLGCACACGLGACPAKAVAAMA